MSGRNDSTAPARSGASSESRECDELREYRPDHGPGGGRNPGGGNGLSQHGPGGGAKLPDEPQLRRQPQPDAGKRMASAIATRRTRRINMIVLQRAVRGGHSSLRQLLARRAGGAGAR